MPKHLILFAVFLALLMVIFYHPIPNPELWDTDSTSLAMPEQGQSIQNAPETPLWQQQFPENGEALSSVP